MTGAERGVWLDETASCHDLTVFAERAQRLDEAAVVRLRQRRDGLIGVWVATDFDVLACRVVGGRVRPADLCAGVDALLSGLAAMDRYGYVNPGFGMDSAWRGVLPPETGFAHLDDVPARVVSDLASQGVGLVKEYAGAHGPPTALLDQEVVAVASGGDAVGIPMRCVFALNAMGFLPQAHVADDFTLESVGSEEVVRVRAMPAWLRIDARFGTVYRRRGDPAQVLR
ncbi:MAG: hypothetical protein K0U78_19950 [Actinomycetia bacterium]|nr:hypothetical protein [Actinomycetes bacterium]